MKLKFYQDRKGEWRWTLTGRNGVKVGASSEGFSTLAKAKANHVKVCNSYDLEPEIVKKPAKKAVKKRTTAVPVMPDRLSDEPGL